MEEVPTATIIPLPGEEAPEQPNSTKDEKNVAAEQSEEPFYKKYRRRLIAIGAILVVAIVVGISLGVSNSSSSVDEDETTTSIPSTRRGFLVSSPESSSDLVVTDCSADSVKVQSSGFDGAAVGDILIYLGGDKLCDECTPLIRKIVSVPEDDEDGIYDFTTVFATVEEVLDPRLYDASVADLEMEPALECTHSGFRRLLVEPTVPHDGRVRGTLSFPTACDSDWNMIDAKGRCLYTNCIVGEEGDPLDCHYCGKNLPTGCDNGCGPEGGFQFPTDFGVLGGDFGPACCNHDYCYSSTYDKDTCDEMFYQEMVESCPGETGHDGSVAFPIVSTPNCRFWSLMYYLAVAFAADEAHEEAQSKQEKKEETAECGCQLPGQILCHSFGSEPKGRGLIEFFDPDGSDPVATQTSRYCCSKGETCCGSGCCKPGSTCCKGKEIVTSSSGVRYGWKCCSDGTVCCSGEDNRHLNCCSKDAPCCGGKCCELLGDCCDNRWCCPPNEKCCGNTCCKQDETCCGNKTCCGPGTRCCGNYCLDTGLPCCDPPCPSYPREVCCGYPEGICCSNCCGHYPDRTNPLQHCCPDDHHCCLKTDTCCEPGKMCCGEEGCVDRENCCYGKWKPAENTCCTRARGLSCPPDKACCGYWHQDPICCTPAVDNRGFLQSCCDMDNNNKAYCYVSDICTGL